MEEAKASLITEYENGKNSRSLILLVCLQTNEINDPPKERSDCGSRGFFTTAKQSLFELFPKVVEDLRSKPA